MRLNEELMEKVEDFFDLISNDQGEIELDSAMDRLRRFLEEDIDGRTQHSEEELATEVLYQMEDLWDLIPEVERQDADLSECFEEIMQDVENKSALSKTEDSFESFEGDSHKEDFEEEDMSEEPPWD